MGRKDKLGKDKEQKADKEILEIEKSKDIKTESSLIR